MPTVLMRSMVVHKSSSRKFGSLMCSIIDRSRLLDARPFSESRVIRSGVLDPRSGQPCSKQVLSKLDPPSRSCKIEPHCGNLSAYHQGQADRIRPMQAASSPDVLCDREQ